MITCVVFLSFMTSLSSAEKNLVLIGGNLDDDNEQIYGKIIDLAGGVGIADIGLITAANIEAEESAIFYEDLFRRYGARDVYWIPVHENNTEANSDPDVVASIQHMTGFFFGGGEQVRIINSFYNNGREESPALAAIRSTYEAGAVVGGTSAGAACMNSAVMIIGGVSYKAILKGAFPLGNATGEDDLVYEPEGGIGFIDNVIIDVHFSERGRQGRLIRLLSDTAHFDSPLGTTYGVGIDEDTALVIHDVNTSETTGEIIGEGGVIFIDMTDAEADIKSPNWGIINVNTHYLTEGDSISLNTFNVSFAEWKSPLRGHEEHNKATISNDIFNGHGYNPLQPAEYVEVGSRLLNSEQSATTYGLTEEQIPRFKVVFWKEKDATGYAGINPRNGEYNIAYSNLKVQIEEGSLCLP